MLGKETHRIQAFCTADRTSPHAVTLMLSPAFLMFSMAPCWPFALLHPADHTCLVTDFCFLTPPHQPLPRAVAWCC